MKKVLAWLVLALFGIGLYCSLALRTGSWWEASAILLLSVAVTAIVSWAIFEIV